MTKTARILLGDNRQTLKTIPDGSVQVCVTSPPYWGLRDYGNDDQIGLEESPQLFVEELCQVFDEVWRVLADDGTLWLNLGDSYSGSGKGPAGNLGAKNNERHLEHKHSAIVPEGLKPKDLVGIPWRVAFALQARGWYLRSDIIWHKPNPMPESVTDRPTKSHEYIFLLSKSAKYFYDHEAVREEQSPATAIDLARRNNLNNKGTHGDVRPDLARSREECVPSDGKRNRRDVWSVATQPFSGAHFATYPKALIEPCILAGSSEHGHCVDCGKGWVRQFEKGITPDRTPRENRIGVIPGRDSATRMQSTEMATIERKFIGWVKNCNCDTDEVRPAIVLDPFSGSGTTGIVAINNGREYIGCELNPEYAQLSEKRIYDEVGLFGSVSIEETKTA